MLRRITVFLGLFFLISSTFAQLKDVERTGGYARLMALGSNPYLQDPTLITMNPAYASVYYDFIWGDLGATKTAFGNDGTGQFAGFNFKVSDQFVIGGILSRADFNGFSISSTRPCSSLVSQLNGAVTAANAVAPGNNLEVVGALNLGKLNIGLGVSYASTSSEYTPGTGGGSTETSASQIGFNVGVLTNTSLVKLDAGVSVVLPSASFTPGTGSETSFSQTIIQAQARLFYKLSQKFALVPSVAFLTSSGTADIASGTTTTNTDLASQMLIGVGVGINYQVGDVLIAGGPMFMRVSTTTPEVANVNPELTSSMTIFPMWNLGLEWQIADWLVGRLGYVAIDGHTSVESTNPADSKKIDETIQSLEYLGSIYTNSIPNRATVGLGFKIGSLSLDATVNTDILRQGLANLGNSGAGATFGYLSVSYGF